MLYSLRSQGRCLYIVFYIVPTIVPYGLHGIKIVRSFNSI